MGTAKDRLSRFLDHLETIFEVEPEFFPMQPKPPGLPHVVCMVYRDIPEPGSITGFTYGLSEATHPAWERGRPELTITVDSTDLAWPLAVGAVANNLRGACPFLYGDVIDFGTAIAEESRMSAFVAFSPSILPRERFLGIEVGGPLPIHIAGMYPLYDAEQRVLKEMGLERFWTHPDFDMYDVTRPEVCLVGDEG